MPYSSAGLLCLSARKKKRMVRKKEEGRGGWMKQGEKKNGEWRVRDLLSGSWHGKVNVRPAPAVGVSHSYKEKGWLRKKKEKQPPTDPTPSRDQCCSVKWFNYGAGGGGDGDNILPLTSCLNLYLWLLGVLLNAWLSCHAAFSLHAFSAPHFYPGLKEGRAEGMEVWEICLLSHLPPSRDLPMLAHLSSLPSWRKMVAWAGLSTYLYHSFSHAVPCLCHGCILHVLFYYSSFFVPFGQPPLPISSPTTNFWDFLYLYLFLSTTYFVVTQASGDSSLLILSLSFDDGENKAAWRRAFMAWRWHDIGNNRSDDINENYSI